MCRNTTKYSGTCVCKSTGWRQSDSNKLTVFQLTSDVIPERRGRSALSWGTDLTPADEHDESPKRCAPQSFIRINCQRRVPLCREQRLNWDIAERRYVCFTNPVFSVQASLSGISRQIRGLLMWLLCPAAVVFLTAAYLKTRFDVWLFITEKWNAN